MRVSCFLPQAFVAYSLNKHCLNKNDFYKTIPNFIFQLVNPDVLQQLVAIGQEQENVMRTDAAGANGGQLTKHV